MKFSDEEIQLIEFCACSIDCQKAECPHQPLCVEGNELCHAIPDKMRNGEDLPSDCIQIIEYFLHNDEKLWKKDGCITKGTDEECPCSTICVEREKASGDFICAGLLKKLDLLTQEEYQILEREVQKVIINSLDSIDWQFDETLRYYGHETPIEVGKPDILLEGTQTRTLYIVELKSDRAKREHVGQLLSYLGWYLENLPDGFECAKGILVAREFDLAATYAIKAAPNLFARRFKLSVEITQC